MILSGMFKPKRTEGQWLLFPYNATLDSTVRYGSDGLIWDGVSSRTPYEDNLVRVAKTPTSVVAFSTSAAEVISSPYSKPYSTTITTPTYLPSSGQHTVIGDYLITYASGLGFSLSDDGGLTWTDYSPPAASNGVTGIGRLASGRWILHMIPSAGGLAFYYTDNALPNGGWVLATKDAGSGGPNSFIAYDGTGDAFSLNNGGESWRTSGGSHWDYVVQLGDTSSYAGGNVKYVSAGGGVWFVSGSSTGQGAIIFKSTDNGITWAKTVLAASPTASTCLQLTYGNGVVVASYTTGMWASSDLGATWTQSANNGLPVYIG